MTQIDKLGIINQQLNHAHAAVKAAQERVEKLKKERDELEAKISGHQANKKQQPAYCL